MSRAHRSIATLLVFALALAATPIFAADAAAKVVNINTATAEELARLPHVGPSIAARILEYRQKNGAFQKAEDLMLVRGIGEKSFAQVKPFITLSGATTLTEKVSSPRTSSSQAKG